MVFMPKNDAKHHEVWYKPFKKTIEKGSVNCTENFIAVILADVYARFLLCM